MEIVGNSFHHKIVIGVHHESSEAANVLSIQAAPKSLA